MNAITAVRNEAVRVRREIVSLLVAEGFKARQIQKVIRVTDRQVLVAQLERSLELASSPEKIRRLSAVKS